MSGPSCSRAHLTNDPIYAYNLRSLLASSEIAGAELSRSMP